MTNKTRQQLARKLKDTRQRKGLTQSDVADKAGISTNYYARIERAEVTPSVEIFERVVKALSVKSSEILPF